MEQFTLEKYLADPTRKVWTRDGRDVRIICTDQKSTTEHPIVALVSEVGRDGKEIEIATDFTINGEYFGDGTENLNDLFFAPQKQSRWVFLFESLAGDIRVSDAYTAKEAAEHGMTKHLQAFALTEITWKDEPVEI